MLHVPCKGPPEVTIALARGEIDVAFPGVTAALPMIDAGKLKAFAKVGIEAQTGTPKQFGAFIREDPVDTVRSKLS